VVLGEDSSTFENSPICPGPRSASIGPHETGQLSTVLATNHLPGRAAVLGHPLHGKTTSDLVYDKSVIASEDVSTARRCSITFAANGRYFEGSAPTGRF